MRMRPATKAPSLRGRGVASAAIAALVFGLTGCTSSPDAGDDPVPEVPGQTRAQRLLELDRDIEADYDRLLELLLEPTRVDSIPLRDSPELAEIAERLPRLQEERRRLEAETAAGNAAAGEAP